jgi:regulator of PEP synthase PpsR (kinase-PPPase family)
MVPPQELFQVDQHKIFGLIISVESLVKLREARLEQLGLAPYARYADSVQVADEIEWCKNFFKQNPRWRIIDVSYKAIEEVSASILSICQKKKKHT